MRLRLVHPDHDVVEIGCHRCCDEAQARLTLKQVAPIYEKYIQLLRDELNEVAPLLVAHGWTSRRFEQGKTCREEIEELRQLT
jgi:hypothetical protein